MATSAPLPATQRIMNYSVGLRDQPASRRGSPIYSTSPFTPCRCPYSGGPCNCTRRCLHRRFCLHPLCTGSATTCPTDPNQVGCVTKLQPSLHATAWRCCSPCFGQDFYYRACLSRVTPGSQVGYDWMVHRHLPSPDSHRLDWQPYGLRAKSAKSGARQKFRQAKKRWSFSLLDQSVRLCVLCVLSRPISVFGFTPSPVCRAPGAARRATPARPGRPAERIPAPDRPPTAAPASGPRGRCAWTSSGRARPHT